MSRRPSRKAKYTQPDDMVVLPQNYWRLTYSTPDNPDGGVIGDELIPRFIRAFIPYSVVKSFALAIDPFHKFKASRVIITAVNRTRKRDRRSVLDSRFITNYRNSATESRTYTTLNQCAGSTSVAPLNTVGVSPQASSTALVTSTLDTTARTRGPGSALGEFEHFSYSISSAPRSTHRSAVTFYQGLEVCTGIYQWTKSYDRRRNVGSGPSGIASSATIDSIRTSDRTALLAEMQKKALGMLPKVLPERRHSTIYRSVIELKDLPRGISQLQETIRTFKTSISHLPMSKQRLITDVTANARNIPKEWLSYNFGWKQIYRDIVELVAAPERITRDINRLIERNGKPTTHRLKQKYLLDTVTTPSMSFAVHDMETNVVIGTQRVRQVELRMMVNATFDFPTLAVPELRQDLWNRKLGLRPTPTDIYNLIPWSWMVDWFTGLGNYIEAIDVINTDRSTFNYGFLTGILTSKLTTTRTSETISTSSFGVFPAASTVINTVNRFSHSSELESTLKIRKDISSAYGAKALLVGNSLSPYQNSILGSILITRSKLAR
jgi:hypothetical protein